MLLASAHGRTGPDKLFGHTLPCLGLQMGVCIALVPEIPTDLPIFKVLLYGYRMLPPTLLLHIPKVRQTRFL